MAIPCPKPNYKRRSPKRARRGEFPPKVRQAIIERDSGRCVKCKKPATQIHHIIFRSQGGLGTEDNGVCVCNGCHAWAHAGREGREWFEEYREQHLLAITT